jgi:hypothetical protein
MSTRKITHFLYPCILVAAAIYIILLLCELAGNREAASQAQQAAEQELSFYRRTCDSLSALNVRLREDINTLSIQTDSLNKLKQQTVIKYERNISNLRNPAAVNNDSIDRYIRSRIGSH